MLMFIEWPPFALDCRWNHEKTRNVIRGILFSEDAELLLWPVRCVRRNQTNIEEGKFRAWRGENRCLTQKKLQFQLMFETFRNFSLHWKKNYNLYFLLLIVMQSSDRLFNEELWQTFSSNFSPKRVILESSSQLELNTTFLTKLQLRLKLGN